MKKSMSKASDLSKSGVEATKTFPDELPGPEHKMQLDWFYITFFALVHYGALYGLFLPSRTFLMLPYIFISGIIFSFGTTAGAHRHFTHKTYKANAPLKILLIAMQTFNLQRSMYTWVRDHRIHHKFTDTNADPHNSRRGFFFSHIGWLLVKPHPDVRSFGSTVDRSDLKADPYVMFQDKFHIPLILASVVISTLIPWYFIGESLKVSFYYGFLFRYVLTLHGTWLVNSAAHLYGTKPYDVNISSRENDLVSFIAFGEGHHNFHHAFPWDYKTSETGKYSLNWSTAFIDFMAKIGWASELKTVSDELIRKRILRTGEMKNNNNSVVTIKSLEDDSKSQVWGWDDPEMHEEDKKLALILNKTISKY